MSFSSYCINLKQTSSRVFSWSLSRFALASLLFFMAAASSHADDWHADLPQAKVIGQGEFRWFGLSIYGAVLWSARTPFDVKAPFALQLTYRRHLSGERIAQTSIDEIKRLFDQRYPAEKLQRWQAAMTKAFPDVNEGDQIIGVLIPQYGCRFYDAKKLLADIDDPEFAQAFFAIWLDPRTKDSSLREHLLGLH